MTVTQESVRKDPRKPIERVACRVHLNTNQENLTDDTWAVVALDTVDYDFGGNFNTTTHRFTAPVSGLYSVIGTAMMLDSSVLAAKPYSIALCVNDTDWRAVAVSHSGVAGKNLSLKVDDTIFLEKNDYLELKVMPSVGANTTDINGTYLYNTFLVIRLISKEGIRQ